MTQMWYVRSWGTTRDTRAAVMPMGVTTGTAWWREWSVAGMRRDSWTVPTPCSRPRLNVNTHRPSASARKNISSVRLWISCTKLLHGSHMDWKNLKMRKHFSVREKTPSGLCFLNNEVIPALTFYYVYRASPQILHCIKGTLQYSFVHVCSFRFMRRSHLLPDQLPWEHTRKDDMAAISAFLLQHINLGKGTSYNFNSTLVSSVLCCGL